MEREREVERVSTREVERPSQLPVGVVVNLTVFLLQNPMSPFKRNVKHCHFHSASQLAFVKYRSENVSELFKICISYILYFHGFG